jgi:phage repressor protein C with HTH and peptisase S24 domain
VTPQAPANPAKPRIPIARSIADMQSIQPQVKAKLNLPFVVKGARPKDHQRMVDDLIAHSFGERLELALRAAGRTQAWLAEMLGISDQAISKWKATGAISRDNLMKVARLLHVSPLWLMNGEGPGPGSTAGSQVATYAVFPPVVGSAKLGDQGFFVELEFPVGHGDGKVEWITRDRNAYAIRCRGDSMKPRIKDGEFVVIEPNRAPTPGDEVLVKDRAGRVMVKELLYTRDEKVHLISVNEAHGKIVIPLSDVEVMHYVAGIAKSELWRPN